jgi:hypothetical protein
MVCERSSMCSINFSSFENIALETKDNCKTIRMDSSGINQNLEGITKLFEGERAPQNYAFVQWRKRRGYDQLLSIRKILFIHFLVHQLFNYQFVSQKWTKCSRSH